MAVNAEADHGVREELEQLKAALREWRDAVADNSKYRGTRNRRDNERAWQRIKAAEAVLMKLV